jgi:hypothetical protein
VAFLQDLLDRIGLEAVRETDRAVLEARIPQAGQVDCLDVRGDVTEAGDLTASFVFRAR